MNPPRRPDPDIQRRLAALADWHRQWSKKQVKDSGFHQRGADSDYNQHHLDVDGASAAAEEEFHARARQIMGLDR